MLSAGRSKAAERQKVFSPFGYERALGCEGLGEEKPLNENVNLQNPLEKAQREFHF